MTAFARMASAAPCVTRRTPHPATHQPAQHTPAHQTSTNITPECVGSCPEYAGQKCPSWTRKNLNERIRHVSRCNHVQPSEHSPLFQAELNATLSATRHDSTGLHCVRAQRGMAAQRRRVHWIHAKWKSHSSSSLRFGYSSWFSWKYRTLLRHAPWKARKTMNCSVLPPRGVDTVARGDSNALSPVAARRARQGCTCWNKTRSRTRGGHTGAAH